MPERTSAIPTWAWIVGAVLVIVSIFTGYRIVQTQQHLAAAQSELESAKQAAEKVKAERTEIQIKLDEDHASLFTFANKIREGPTTWILSCFSAWLSF